MKRLLPALVAIVMGGVVAPSHVSAEGFLDLDVDVEITDSFDDTVRSSLQTHHVDAGFALRF